MILVRRFKTGFFREPRRSRFDWIPIGIGLVILALALAGILVNDAGSAVFSANPAFSLLGAGFIVMGTAELLPLGRHRLAAVLRFIGIISFVSCLVAILLTT